MIREEREREWTGCVWGSVLSQANKPNLFVRNNYVRERYEDFEEFKWQLIMSICILHKDGHLLTIIQFTNILLVLWFYVILVTFAIFFICLMIQAIIFYTATHTLILLVSTICFSYLILLGIPSIVVLLIFWNANFKMGLYCWSPRIIIRRID